MVSTLPRVERQEEKRWGVWSQSLAKGDTIRAMWFYQNSLARNKGLYIWFDTLRAAIVRTNITPGLEWLDLGPSYSEASREVKVKYEFRDVDTWKSECNYGKSGFVKLPRYESLGLVNNNESLEKAPQDPILSNE